MPDMGKALKDEITRITKRESKKWMAEHIKTIRSLKQEVAALKKQIGEPAEAAVPQNARPALTPFLIL